MKHYALALVSNATGDIEHITTSQVPQPDNRVGLPVGWESTHTLVRFEFDSDADSGHAIMRAKSALEEFEYRGNSVVRKAGANRAANIASGKAFSQQAAEHMAAMEAASASAK